MIRTIIITVVLLNLVACDWIKTKNEDADQVTDMVTTPLIEENSSTEKSTTQKILRGTFESAVVYAGTTEYYFKLEGSEEYYSFRVSNIEGMTAEEFEAEKDYLEGMNIGLGVRLIDPSEDIEGPPGANTRYLHRMFELVFDAEETLLEVRLAEEEL